MKKELLNEVSRIKNMMKQLNEDDFTVNNEEPRNKYYWSSRISKEENLYKERVYDQLVDLIGDDEDITIIMDEFKNRVTFKFDYPEDRLRNLSKEELEDMERESMEDGENWVSRANRGGGPFSLEVVNYTPTKIMFEF